MTLSDGPRQIVAASLASAGFLGLFFGVGLVWWLALVLAILIYGAALLMIRRRRMLSEISLASRVTAEDLSIADRALREADARLERALKRAPQGDQGQLQEMRQDLDVLRQNILDDPNDFRAVRGFLKVQLPEIVGAVDSYVRLAAQSTPETEARIRELGAQIRELAAPIRRMRIASVENDLRALDIEVSVLTQTLGRR